VRVARWPLSVVLTIAIAGGALVSGCGSPAEPTAQPYPSCSDLAGRFANDVYSDWELGGYTNASASPKSSGVQYCNVSGNGRNARGHVTVYVYRPSAGDLRNRSFDDSIRDTALHNIFVGACDGTPQTMTGGYTYALECSRVMGQGPSVEATVAVANDRALAAASVVATYQDVSPDDARANSRDQAVAAAKSVLAAL